MKNISVNNVSAKPIYQQLYDQISAKILNGELHSDEMLPSIRKTAKELRVSIITIKKTWELLERDGYIYTVSGKGSYVSTNTEQNLETKKIELAKESLRKQLKMYTSLGISENELIELVKEIYREDK